MRQAEPDRDAIVRVSPLHRPPHSNQLQAAEIHLQTSYSLLSRLNSAGAYDVPHNASIERQLQDSTEHYTTSANADTTRVYVGKA